MAIGRGALQGRDVPFRTILATIGLVVATYLTWQFIQQTWPILQLIIIAAFFAMALNPAVDALQHRGHMPRGLATAIVVVLGIAILGGLGYLFIRPIVEQTDIFISSLPGFVQDAVNGRGVVGRFIDRYDLDTYVIENQARLQGAITSSTTSAISVISTIFSTVISLVTVLVLSVMMLLEGPRVVRLPLVFFKPATQVRIRAVAGDAAKAVTGYTLGQLLLSTIAGTVTFITMTLLDTPYPLVLAVWVAFCALIPLIGSYLGAIATVSVSMIHGWSAGLIAFIVFVVYQQIENNFVQPTIMSRTVRLNPLTVLVSVLLGVQLAGLLGAILAIPLVGGAQVIVRDIFDHNRGRFSGDVTTGADMVPVDTTDPTDVKKDDLA